jgi:riboflavin kinase
MKALKGKVVSGIGNFSYWIKKLDHHYHEKTGMLLFPGTLNIKLKEPYDLPANVIRLEKEEYGGTVSVSIQPCKVFNRAAFILRTDKNASGEGPHKKTIIEIATDVKLRDTYSLKDGDEVEVIIT